MITKDFEYYTIYEDSKVYCKVRKTFLNSYMNSGYLEVYVYLTKNELTRIKLHRLMAISFLPNTENFPVVNHKDGNKVNNSITNLEWCTYKHNNQHAIDTGLNNVSVSNSVRWEDKEWADKTRKNMSEACIAKGSNAGRNNSRFKYEIVAKDTNKIYTAPEFFEEFVDKTICSRKEYVSRHCKEFLDGKVGKCTEFFSMYNAEPRLANKK